MDYIISTESTSDLPLYYTEEHDVKVIAMPYMVDDKEYGGDTGVDIAPLEFYTAMREGKSTHTAMISRSRAIDYFDRLGATGKDILHISFASACSGTYECMAGVAEEYNAKHSNKIYVLDSKAESCGQGVIVRYAVDNAASGMTVQDNLSDLQVLRDRINHVFTVYDLRYLARGGRISKASANIGNMLNIKPLLYVNEEGRLIPWRKIISRRVVLNKMISMFAAKYDGNGGYIVIGHCDCMDDARYVAEEVEKISGIKPEINDIMYVIGCHSGPGTLALFFSGENRNVEGLKI